MNPSGRDTNRRKILLVGWDAADWKIIHPLLDAGKLPNLARLVEGGVMGNIATLQPALSPMLWSSIATGKRPYKHGIHGFSEPDPVSGGIRPVTNLSRSTKAVWNILNQCGKNTITVGWWPSNPAEPLSRGVMVSNDYQTAHGAPHPWPLKPGTVHPQRLEAVLADLRFHPSELTEEDLRPFLPGLEGMSQQELDGLELDKDPRIQSLMKIIADATSIHSAATALIQNEPWDLMCVYYDAIDHFGHGFMKYHPPRRRQVGDMDFRVFHHCVEMGYIFQDAMLGTLLHLAGDDATVVLMSDHGFHPDDLRLGEIPREPAGPAAEHRQFGIFVAKGPGIRRDARIDGASLLDVCPTLLHLFGLQVGEDMDGRVLLDIYDPQAGAVAAVESIPSWDEVPGDHGMHPPDRQISAEDSQAALQQLVDLGYIDAPSSDQSQAMAQTVRELDYNLAQAYLDGGLHAEAADLLERLYAAWPQEHRFGFKLALCYQNQNRAEELRALVSVISARRMREAEEAAGRLRELGAMDEIALAAERERIGAMSERDQTRLYRERKELVAKASPNLFTLRLLEAWADLAERRYEDALGRLEQLDHDFGARRNALTFRGEVLQRLRRWEESRAAFLAALEIDAESPGPLLGLARTALAQEDFPAAAAHARTSLGLLYFQPKGHYILGLALYRSGEWREARRVFLTCVAQAPLFTAAFRMLGQIARFYQKDAVAQSEYAIRLEYARKQLTELAGKRQIRPQPVTAGPAMSPMPRLSCNPEANAGAPADQIITVVSGLPRSGTSLMMQLLEAAGIPAFTDGNRKADGSNPRGYYENDQVAGLRGGADRSWIVGARGGAVKVVAPLLASLPVGNLIYQVIFMEREMDEVLASQDTMLRRLGKNPQAGADLAKVYQQQVRHAKAWILEHDIPAISISYTDLIHRPEAALADLSDFLKTPEKTTAMRAVIDPKLHRARREHGKNCQPQPLTLTS